MLLLGFMATNNHGASLEMPYAYTLQITPRSVAKLPTTNNATQLSSDLFFSTCEKRQSFQAIAEIDNPELKAYLAQLSRTTLAITKSPQKQKSTVFSITFSLDDESLSWVTKCIIRKSNDELNISITPYVLPNTDPEAITAITNFCNALFPQLSFMQKHGKTIGVVTTLTASAACTAYRKKIKTVAIRRATEFANFIAKKRRVSFLKKFLIQEKVVGKCTRQHNNKCGHKSNTESCQDCRRTLFRFSISDEMDETDAYCFNCAINLLDSHFQEKATNEASLPRLRQEYGKLIKKDSEAKTDDAEEAASTCSVCVSHLAKDMRFKTIKCICNYRFHEYCLLNYFKPQTYECATRHTPDGGLVEKTSTTCPACNDGIKKV